MGKRYMSVIIAIVTGVLWSDTEVEDVILMSDVGVVVKNKEGYEWNS